MRVVVIGGGFAGLAAAVALQERRHQVTLIERRGVLGGRATSYPDAASGEDVDNGPHVLLGGYTATLDLIRRAGAEDLLVFQDDLRLDFMDSRGRSTVACPPLPAPLHMLAGLLWLRAPWKVRVAAARLVLALRFGRRPDPMTLAHYFERLGQGPEVRRLLWDPILTLLLNEAPERLSAAAFHDFCKKIWLASRESSRLVLLRRGYGVLHERLAHYFEARGGAVRRRALAEAVEVENGRATTVHYVQRAETRDEMRRGKASRRQVLHTDAVVAAVPWHAVPGLLPEAWRAEPPFNGLTRLAPASSLSVELWLDRVVVDRALVGFTEGEVACVFDKGRMFGREGPPQHLSCVIGPAHRHVGWTSAELAAAAESTLRRFFPAMAGATVLRSLPLRERHASFAGDPDSEPLRPAATTPIEGLFLAGDWTRTGLPPTIEGAVRSGFAAAAAAGSRWSAQDATLLGFGGQPVGVLL